MNINLQCWFFFSWLLLLQTSQTGCSTITSVKKNKIKYNNKKLLYNKSYLKYIIYIHAHTHTRERNGYPLQYCYLENPMKEELVGYSPWGHRRVRRDLVTQQQQHIYIYTCKHTCMCLCKYAYVCILSIKHLKCI